MADTTEKPKRRERKSYRIEATESTKLAVDRVRETYGLTTSAEAIRKALSDEIQLLQFAEHPEVLDAWRALRDMHSHDVGALDKLALAGVPDNSKEITETRAVLEDISAKLDMILYHTHKLGTNVNQIAKAANSNKAVAQIVPYILGMQNDVVAPLNATVDDLKGVLHDARFDKHQH